MNNRFVMIGAGALIIVLIAGGIFLIRLSKRDADATQQAPASSNKTSAQQLYAQASALKQDGKLTEAKDSLQAIMTDHSDYENISGVEKELEQVNMQFILTNAESPKAIIHQVAPGETLGKIAKVSGTTVDLIKKRNNLLSDVIRVGQRLSIWTGQFNVFVDKSQNILILKDGADVVKVYNVSTGANNSSPVGEFTVTSKLTDPVWFNKGIVVPPESPANVLGTRWLGFEEAPGYGIHGTVEPDKIGQQVTAGCVRMRNEEVEELYSILPMGTKVTIVD